MSEMNKQNILDQLVSAFLEVDMLNNRAHEWRMTIPARVTDSDVVISNALHQIKPLIEMVEKLRAERDALLEQNKQLREQLIKIGGELAQKTTECVNCNLSRLAWRDVVENYIRARDCSQHDEADLQLNILRVMVDNTK